MTNTARWHTEGGRENSGFLRDRASPSDVSEGAQKLSIPPRSTLAKGASSYKGLKLLFRFLVVVRFRLLRFVVLPYPPPPLFHFPVRRDDVNPIARLSTTALSLLVVSAHSVDLTGDVAPPFRFAL